MTVEGLIPTRILKIDCYTIHSDIMCNGNPWLICRLKLPQSSHNEHFAEQAFIKVLFFYALSLHCTLMFVKQRQCNTTENAFRGCCFFFFFQNTMCDQTQMFTSGTLYFLCFWTLLTSLVKQTVWAVLWCRKRKLFKKVCDVSVSKATVFLAGCSSTLTQLFLCLYRTHNLKCITFFSENNQQKRLPETH